MEPVGGREAWAVWGSYIYIYIGIGGEIKFEYIYIYTPKYLYYCIG